ncbi:YjbF family lipoprotein [Vibrio sp. VB16]|uniref:YjbF family lipoprotein n=1 Tax=Vibrio sp. VB16 TaxID=2785746 RepID=UPI00189DF559|nr:YjbF family lipoprotein [Vibrio sp. VB16]UGA57369.1 YjbF family lipoprotein [Vibrio sp. VB16]
MKILKISVLTVALSTIFIAGCTQNFQHVNSTINEGVFGFDDANKSEQEIAGLPYASSNVTIDDGSQIFVVLALVEPSSNNKGQTQLKWTSSDYGMLVTENGRLVKTLKLPQDNLAGLADTNSGDPLALYGQKPNQHTWHAVYDWQPDYRYHFVAKINWHFVSQQDLTSAAWTKKTNYYREEVYIPSLDVEFTNQFWLDAITHEVVKSIQYIGPDMSSVDMTILKPYAG